MFHVVVKIRCRIAATTDPKLIKHLVEHPMALPPEIGCINFYTEVPPYFPIVGNTNISEYTFVPPTQVNIENLVVSIVTKYYPDGWLTAYEDILREAFLEEVGNEFFSIIRTKGYPIEFTSIESRIVYS